jgi:alkylation response protein AidB-like acyl-CoA dehydrogenase
MTHDTAVLKAREIASRVLAPTAGQNDKAGRFSTEAVEALGESGLLGLLLPVDFGGSGLGPSTFAVVMATLAEADASVAMVYLMHILGTATISAARPGGAQTLAPILREIGAGRHLCTLAFSEAGSRSHFWAPVSRANRNADGVSITTYFAAIQVSEPTSLTDTSERKMCRGLPSAVPRCSVENKIGPAFL